MATLTVPLLQPADALDVLQPRTNAGNGQTNNNIGLVPASGERN